MNGALLRMPITFKRTAAARAAAPASTTADAIPSCAREEKELDHLDTSNSYSKFHTQWHPPWIEFSLFVHLSAKRPVDFPHFGILSITAMLTGSVTLPRPFLCRMA
jgi:hypothetical protein